MIVRVTVVVSPAESRTVRWMRKTTSPTRSAEDGKTNEPVFEPVEGNKIGCRCPLLSRSTW